MTVQEAKEEGVCRVCGHSVATLLMPETAWRDGWRDRFGNRIRVFPIALNYGDEFAHEDCLRLEKRTK